MQDTTTGSTSPPSPLSTVQRLLIAFLLGLPVGFVATFTEQSVHAPGIYGLWELPVALLIATMLVSIVLDPNVRQGKVPLVRVIVGIIAILLLSAIVIAGEVVLLKALQNPDTNPNLNFVNLVVLPLLVPLAVAFALGSNDGWLLALGTGWLAWLGAGLHFVIIALIDYIIYEQHTPGGDGGIALPLTIAWAGTALLLAAPGSVLGRLLRKGVLGE